MYLFIKELKTFHLIYKSFLLNRLVNVLHEIILLNFQRFPRDI